MDVNEINLSLNGCGYLGIYHVGVCSCIKKYYPQVLKNKISGGSVGALVACAFMCDVPLEICTKYVFEVSMRVRDGILGPMSPDLNIMRLLYESMDAMLPPDAHLHCDGRLHVSVTRFDTGKNVLLNSFSSKEELLQALMCSCFIPIYCGYEPPVFHGVAYVDAALSNNSPWIDKGTVTVAPFSGNSNICPENDGMFLRSFTLSNTSIGLTAKNMYMLFRVLFPGSPEMQKQFCQRGYSDALRFLRNNGLIPCPGCVDDGKNQHKNCKTLDYPMQKEIAGEIESAIEIYQKNLSYRLFQYRSMQMLYYLNIPSIVTAKVAYVVVSAVVQKVHNKANSCVDDLWRYFIQILSDGLRRQNNLKRLQNHHNGLSMKSANSIGNEVTAASKILSPEENECESVLCKSDEEEKTDAHTHNLISDVRVDVPRKNSNLFSSEKYSVKPKRNKTHQFEFPFCETQNEDLKPCIC